MCIGDVSPLALNFQHCFVVCGQLYAEADFFVPTELTAIVGWSREMDSIEWKGGRTSKFMP